MLYEIYGKIHQTVKRILRRGVASASYRMVSVDKRNVSADGMLNLDGENIGSFFNELNPQNNISLLQAYPVENIVADGTFLSYKDSFIKVRKCSEKQLGVKSSQVEKAWYSFIDRSIIPKGFRNNGLHYAGYILDDEAWCLPSWIWTNAAIVRMYCTVGQIEKAKALSDRIIDTQEECGGWIVRNDYDSKGAVPVLAPNDSAYIANNGCLEVYLETAEKKYLNAAVRCAEWIMDTVRKDGMVYVGYNIRENCWQTKHNIVDVGFTAGLFARLYKVLNDVRYLNFLERFTGRYIELFYKTKERGFATSLDQNNQQIGGLFGRGQAWALEGLIPSYEVTKNQKIKQVIEDTVDTLIRLQNRTGGWAYNLSRPFMGIDGKATPIIAFSLMNWSTEEKVINTVRKALDWTMRHTSPAGRSKGGIFSYTTEGAVVHHMYTWTAFVYSSAYAIELKKKLGDRN